MGCCAVCPRCAQTCGLHGALHVGPRRNIAHGEQSDLAATLAALRIELACDGKTVDRGVGANVLDGPLQALAHLVAVLGSDAGNPPLRAGEMVTTGTLTRAFPVRPGEIWSTRIEGFALPGLSAVMS